MDRGLAMHTRNQFRRAVPYILPAFIIMLVFTYYPLGDAIVQSFNRNRHPSDYEFSLATYRWLLNDREFQTAFRNTMIYTAVVTPASVLISMMIAGVLVNIRRFRALFQTIFFVPYVTSAVAVAFTWAYLFNTHNGLVNLIRMNLFGLPRVAWLTDPSIVNNTVIVFGIWRGLAFNILILTTAMLSIDPQYYRAALVDGSEGRTTFFRITVPLISPVIAYLLTIGLINSFRVFNEVYALVGERSRSLRANTLVIYIFDQVWVARDFSLAAAASVVFLIVILALTAFSRWVAAKTSYYG